MTASTPNRLKHSSPLRQNFRLKSPDTPQQSNLGWVGPSFNAPHRRDTYVCLVKRSTSAGHQQYISCRNFSCESSRGSAGSPVVDSVSPVTLSPRHKPLTAYLVAEPARPVRALVVLQEGLPSFNLSLPAGMAAEVHKIARRAWFVVLKGDEKLSLSWPTETCIGDRIRERLVALHFGSELAKVLYVVIADPRTGRHDHGTHEDVLVLGLVLLPGIGGGGREVAILLQEVVARTSVEVLAHASQDRAAIDLIPVDHDFGSTQGAEDIALRDVFVLGPADFLNNLAHAICVIVTLEEARKSVSGCLKPQPDPVAKTYSDPSDPFWSSWIFEALVGTV